MTTNGATLAPGRRTTSAHAGLDRVNISCDSLRRDRFAEITQPRRPAGGARGHRRRAKAAGFDPIKVNWSLMRGVNDDEVVDFATLRAGARRGRALHRVHAARRPGPMERRAGASPGRDRRRHRRRLPARAGRAHGAEPASGSATSTGAGARVGVIASVTRAVLRRLRPGPARPPRASCAPACSPSTSTTCGRRCAAAPPTTSWSSVIRGAVARQMGRAHQIGNGGVHPAPAEHEPDRRLMRPQAVHDARPSAGRPCSRPRALSHV